MKIALICTEKLPVPPIAGGAVQLYIDGILPQLSCQHSVTVVGIKHPELPDRELINGVEYIRVAGQNRNEYIRNVRDQLTDNFDLIHIFNRPRYVKVLGEAFPSSRISLSLHNEMFDLEKIPAREAEECINRVEFITTVSKFIADGVSRLYPIAADKLHTVYSGADINTYKPYDSQEAIANKEKLKRKYGIEGKKVVLFVGRLSEKKGVDKLLGAMKKVMDMRSDVALVVIGSKWYGSNTSDDYTNSIKILAETLAGPIIFTGFLPPSQIPEQYNIGDVFVCPSQWNEPLARVHYEAMAAGLPIITTNRGGNAEVIQGYKNGIVMDDFSNIDLLADLITGVLNDEAAAKEMGREGRKLAEQKYSWDRVSSDLLKLFEQVEESIKTGKKPEFTVSEITSSKDNDLMDDDISITIEETIIQAPEKQIEKPVKKPIKSEKKDSETKAKSVQKPPKQEKSPDINKEKVEVKLEEIDEVVTTQYETGYIDKDRRNDERYVRMNAIHAYYLNKYGQYLDGKD